MFCFKDIELNKINEKLADCKSIGIVSCGGCPAYQKKGGTVGIDRWKSTLNDTVNIAWTLIAPRMCDKRLLRIHIEEIATRLVEVDVLLVMSCSYGEEVLQELFGYPTVGCLETLYFGIMEDNGEIKKVGVMQECG